MNKLKLLAAAVPLLFTTAYAEDITVTVNGETVEFDQPPVIDNDRTLVPMRAIFEALGAEVIWDGDTRTVTSTKDDTVIVMTIDSTQMYVGENAVTLDVPAKIVSDRTMVPVRAISEALTCEVIWEADTRTVVIMQAIAEPEISATTEPTTEAVQVPLVAAVGLEDDTNIFDPEWLIAKSEINSANGTVKTNANTCATDYIAINAGKSYFAGYYQPNECAYKANYCVKYAFYDADKNYISGEGGDLSKLVKAPQNAAYLRFTVNLAIDSRGCKYIDFMQTDTVPKTFAKSEKVRAAAQTELFKDKKIMLFGDQQANNATVWTNLVDEQIGANVFSVKGLSTLAFTSVVSSSLSAEKTLQTIPADADYLIVFAGFYDWTHSYSLGDEMSSSGGIYDFLGSVKTKWPNTKVIMMTLPTAKYAYDGFTEGGKYNKLGMNTKDYSELIIEACEANNVEYIDISQLWDYDNITEYMKTSDLLSYLYLNENGGKLVADMVVEKLIDMENR